MHSIRFTIFDAAPERPVLRCFGRDGRLVGDRPLVGAEVDAFVADVEAGYRAVMPDLLGLGRRLFQWLDGPTERWLASAREQPGTLVVEIDGDERLRHLPWELLANDGFLAADPVRPIIPVRLVRRPAPELAIANRPLRVLFMASSPEDVTPELSYEEEEARLLQATARSPLELEVEESGSLVGLGERLDFAGSDYFDVVHLTGHATVHEGQPLFLLEGEVGEPAPATPEDVAALFVAGWPSLVFLSGCRTGEAPSRGAVPSFAEQLLLAGAPAVLAWALPVGDQSATVAAAEIYQHLATGRTAAEAAIRARVELRKSGSPYWHLLRFYGEAKCLAPRVTPPGAKGRPRLTIRPVAKQLVEAGGSFEVCPRERFIGRRREIQRCLRTLRAQQDAEIYRDGVLLHGMGGLGKSSLAVRLVERLSSTHKPLFWAGRLDETRLLQPFNKQLTDPEAIARLGDARLPLQNRLQELLDGPLANQPTLFVLDDFEHNVETDEDKAPRLDSAGRAILQAEPLAVLTALLGAIRDTGSASRVIVTCRYRFALPAPIALWEETPPTLRGADLGKKLGQLTALGPRSSVPKETKERATALAAGNPRLLEHLDRALVDSQSETETLFEKLEQTAEKFRENVILEALLQRLEPTGRQLLAFLGLFQLPIDRPTLQATADALPVEPHLTKALALGLAEQTREPGGPGELYFTSAVLQPVLEGVATEEELKAAAGRAARYLAPLWSEDEKGWSEARLLQLHRIAIHARDSTIAADAGDALCGTLIRSSRFRDAHTLAAETLGISKDPRLRLRLAHALRDLGELPHALDELVRLVEDLQDLATTGTPARLQLSRALQHLGSLVLFMGDAVEARKYLERSLGLVRELHDPEGELACLHEIAIADHRLGRKLEARRAHETILKANTGPTNPISERASLHELGVLELEAGDLSNAAKLFAAALESSRESGDHRRASAAMLRLAEVQSRLGQHQTAISLCTEALEIKRTIEDKAGEAAALLDLGIFSLRLSDYSPASEYCRRALELSGAIGDRALAAQTLKVLSSIRVGQGAILEALQILSQSLELWPKENSVDRAATSANMAILEAKLGKFSTSRARLAAAVADLAGLGSWHNVFLALSSFGAFDPERGACLLAQAVWLSTRVSLQPNLCLNGLHGMKYHLDPLSEPALIMAAAAPWLVSKQAEAESAGEELETQACAFLIQLAKARGTSLAAIESYLAERGLDDPARLLPLFEQTLESLVPEGEWAFDRSLLPRLQL